MWLSAGDMVGGLALAESTPGPLIMVVQFVAFLGAYHNPGTLNPWTAGGGRVAADHVGHLVQQVGAGPLHMILPGLAAARPVPLVIAVIAAVLIFWRSWPVLRVLGVSAGLGLVAGLAGLPGI